MYVLPSVPKVFGMAVLLYGDSATWQPYALAKNSSGPVWFVLVVPGADRLWPLWPLCFCIFTQWWQNHFYKLVLAAPEQRYTGFLCLLISSCRESASMVTELTSAGGRVHTLTASLPRRNNIFWSVFCFDLRWSKALGRKHFTGGYHTKDVQMSLSENTHRQPRCPPGFQSKLYHGKPAWGSLMAFSSIWLSYCGINHTKPLVWCLI